MSLKVKLITSISAFFLMLALLVTGVFAARNLVFTFGGTINFEGVNGNVDALVTAEVTGTATPITLDDISIEQGDTEVAVPESWQNLDLTFPNAGAPIKIKFSITNRREDRALYVVLSVSELPTTGSDVGENVYGGFDSTGNGIYSGQKTITLQPQSEEIVEFAIFVNTMYSPVDNVDVSFRISFGDTDPE